MIAFGCPITDHRAWERYAEPGIRLAGEPDSEVFAFRNAGSIFRAYNLFCDQAAKHGDLEALVLLHQDVEIVDPDLCSKVRDAFRDPEVAVAGCVGAVGVRSIAWWEGAATWGGYTQRLGESGAELPGISWPDVIPSYVSVGEVDTIDGILLALSPWAVRELRFDESLGRLHGYDLDICLQARAAGKKVITIDTRVVHHHPLDLVGDWEGWIAAHMKIAEKWSDILEDGRSQDWHQRARRAEAEVDAARTQLRFVQENLVVLAYELEAVERSQSWRLTKPLRALSRVARRIRHPRRTRGRASAGGAKPSRPWRPGSGSRSSTASGA